MLEQIDRAGAGGMPDVAGILYELEAGDHSAGSYGRNPTAGAAGQFIRIDILRHYRDLVLRLGGNPQHLLTQVDIVDCGLGNNSEFIPYRKMVDLLHNTAAALNRPDFGLLLAGEQEAVAMLGPLEVAMRNSPTIGDALSYYMAHYEVFSPAASMVMERDAYSNRIFFRLETHVRHLPHPHQASEHAMALLHHGLVALSNGKVRSREVWFSHSAACAPAYYRRYFAARVEMNMPFTALFIDEADLAVRLPGPTRALFDLADAFIDKKCSEARTLSNQVCSILKGRLPQGPVTKADVAKRLNMHPKTLQRRLCDEGNTFEMLRDQVRRDVALRFLTESTIPITRIAAMLGYSETAVLSRSCRQWFGRSPREIRRQTETQPRTLANERQSEPASTKNRVARISSCADGEDCQIKSARETDVPHLADSNARFASRIKQLEAENLGLRQMVQDLMRGAAGQGTMGLAQDSTAMREFSN